MDMDVEWCRGVEVSRQSWCWREASLDACGWSVGRALQLCRCLGVCAPPLRPGPVPYQTALSPLPWTTSSRIETLGTAAQGSRLPRIGQSIGYSKPLHRRFASRASALPVFIVWRDRRRVASRHRRSSEWAHMYSVHTVYSKIYIQHIYIKHPHLLRWSHDVTASPHPQGNPFHKQSVEACQNKTNQRHWRGTQRGAKRLASASLFPLVPLCSSGHRQLCSLAFHRPSHLRLWKLWSSSIYAFHLGNTSVNCRV